MPNHPLRRKAPRVPVNWPGVVLAGQKRIPCAVVDVSLGGARLDLPDDVAAKSYVILLCEKFGSLDGHVVWRKGSLAGIRFADPTAAAQLRPHVKLAAGAPATAPVTATVRFGRRKV